MPFNDEYKLLFVHIPKTGGQSIHQMFNMSMFPTIPEHEDAHLMAITIRQRYYTKFKQYFKFAIVRHPLDRLVSEYFFSKKYRPYLLDTENIPFSEYVQRIAEINLRRSNHCLVNHLYPQSWFIYKKNSLLVDYVGRFETFQNSIETIAKKARISVPTTIHKNRSSHANFMEYYDSTTEMLARKMYEEDFRRLGY